MPTKKTKKPVKKKTVKKQSLPVVKKISCLAHKGEACAYQTLLLDTFYEALAATVWYHRIDTDQNEFIVSGIELQAVDGKQQLKLSITRLMDLELGDHVDETLSLHQFLQEFIPAREININDYHA